MEATLLPKFIYTLMLNHVGPALSCVSLRDLSCLRAINIRVIVYPQIDLAIDKPTPARFQDEVYYT